MWLQLADRLKMSWGSVDRNRGSTNAGEQMWVGCVNEQALFSLETRPKPPQIQEKWCLLQSILPNRALHSWSQSECLLNVLALVQPTAAGHAGVRGSFALAFSEDWGELLSQQGANPSSLFCVRCVRCLLSLYPLMFPSEDEEQRWSSSGSTFLCHRSPPRVIRERKHLLPKFLTMGNSLLAYFHF